MAAHHQVNAGSVDHAALLGHTIDKNRLQFVSILGLGAYGVVYLAKDVSASIGASSATDPSSPYSGKGYYAVKCLNKSGLDARQRNFQRREIALHTLASQHPNIVSLHRVVETSSVIYVILEYCPDGDLFGMITEQSRYLGHDELIRSVFLQIIDAVDYCHRLGIYHRDLKPENILCCDNGQRVLLADFGLATAEKMSWDFGCGSTFYMSPECQGGVFERLGSYSTLHNDTWSLGVILVNLTCGRNPWKQACPSDETFRAYLDNPDFLRSILPISAPCNDLLKRIFTLNPMGRISIAELRQAVINMPRWTMTVAELRTATRATREAAKAFVQVDAQRPHPSQKSTRSEVSENYPESVSTMDTDGSTAYSFASSISFPNWSGISDLHKAPQHYKATPAPTRPVLQPHRDSPHFNQHQDTTPQVKPVAVLEPLQENRPLPSTPQTPSTPRRRRESGSARLGFSSTTHSNASRSSASSTSSSDFCDASSHISSMDIDERDHQRSSFLHLSDSNGPSVLPSTPRCQLGSNYQLANRRKHSISPPSSSGSSSSSDSWDSDGSMPVTPNTPTFLRSQQPDAQISNLELAVQKMNSMVSTTSSKASFHAYYDSYASWVDQEETKAVLLPASNMLETVR